MGRLKAISEMKEKLLKVENLMHSWQKSHPHITVEERSSVLMKVEDVYRWISEKEHAQNEIDPTMDPVFTSEQVSSLSKPIESLIATLRKKPKPIVRNEEKKEVLDEMNSNETTDNYMTPINSGSNNSNHIAGEGGTDDISNSTLFNNISGKEGNNGDEF